MPESVKDRPTRAHEYIFLLSKSPRYYYDAEAVKEPAVGFYNAAPAGSAGTGKPNARRRGNSRTFRGGGAYTHDRAQNNSATVERESHGSPQTKAGKETAEVFGQSPPGHIRAHTSPHSRRNSRGRAY